jgi:hypothetical protein
MQTISIENYIYYISNYKKTRRLVEKMEGAMVRKQEIAGKIFSLKFSSD